jgi:endonuclease/exonuclease/phosphatase family metal-dependent hydrolase
MRKGPQRNESGEAVAWSLEVCDRSVITFSRTVLALVALLMPAMSCSHPAPRVVGEESQFPAGTAPPTFKLLTYNAWHGLNTGEFWVTPSESPEQHLERLRFQARQIAAVSPDVVFLQEVNPLPQQAMTYVRELEGLGLEYTEVHQVDACGVRLRKKAALIPGLNNGLAILAKAELRLKKITGLKLSGDLGNCGSASGFQLGELRYAVIGEITLPGTARKYLVASTHFHSGFETGTQFLGELGELHKQKRFQRYAHLSWEVEKSQLRRIGELDKLVRELRKLMRQEGYSGFAVGGDFNFEPDSPEYEEAALLRLSDTRTLTACDGNLYTADPARNGLILQGEEPAIPTLLLAEIKKEPSGVQEEITAAYRIEMRRPRRIDHIFVERFLHQHSVTERLFGLATDAAGLPASDHFGIVSTHTSQALPCEGSPKPNDAGSYPNSREQGRNGEDENYGAQGRSGMPDF